MRIRGGSGHACKRAGVLIVVALAIAACSGQPQQAREYGLGGERPATPGSSRDFASNVGDVVHFQVDSAKLTPEAQNTLRGQVRWLNQYEQYMVTIEGHADERGTREYNLALGAQRAMAVKGFLLRNGLGAGRIHTISYGKERPVAVCDDISCWSQNRRAQTILKSGAVARY